MYVRRLFHCRYRGLVQLLPESTSRSCDRWRQPQNLTRANRTTQSPVVALTMSVPATTVTFRDATDLKGWAKGILSANVNFHQ